MKRLLIGLMLCSAALAQAVPPPAARVAYPHSATRLAPTVETEGQAELGHPAAGWWRAALALRRAAADGLALRQRATAIKRGARGRAEKCGCIIFTKGRAV
jgi:hypothetical protein